MLTVWKWAVVPLCPPFGSLPSRQALPNRLRGHRIVTTQPVDGCSGTSPVASGVLVTTAFLRTAITMTSRIPAWDRRSDVWPSDTGTSMSMSMRMGTASCITSGPYRLSWTQSKQDSKSLSCGRQGSIGYGCSVWPDGVPQVHPSRIISEFHHPRIFRAQVWNCLLSIRWHKLQPLSTNTETM